MEFNTECVFFILLVILIIVGCSLKIQIAALAGLVVVLLGYFTLLSRQETLMDNPGSPTATTAVPRSSIAGVTEAGVDAQTVDDDDASRSIKGASKFKQEWDNSLAVYDMFSQETPETASDGDSRLAEKMKEVSLKNKLAIEARTRFNSDNARIHFQDELDEQEKRHWWEHDDLDAFMVKD